MSKYQRGTEPPIEAEAVDELLDIAEGDSSNLPQWVINAQKAGRLRIQRSLIEIVGGNFAATATRRDMLCFDESKEEGSQIFYLSAIQFRRYRNIES